MTETTQTTRNRGVAGFLGAIERIGNALPHPATLFAILAGLAATASWLLSRLGVTAVHPKDGTAILPVNLVSREGLHWILDNTVGNYTGFAPLVWISGNAE